MTVKSVLDIDINSGEFQKFAEMYQKYQEQQAKTAAVAKQSGKEQVNTRNTFAQQVELMKLQARLAQESHTAQDKQQKTLAQSDRLWTSMAKSTKSVGSSIIDATRSLLSWTGILTGIGGLLGAGGLFGLDRMANTVGNERRSAMGLGMSIGQQKAFQTNFSRIVDPDAFLNWISQMESDPSKRATASALGFQITGNAEQDSLRALKALRGKSKEWDPSLYGTMLHAYGVGGVDVEGMRRMRTTGGAEWNQLFAGNDRDISKFNIQENVAKQWQDFSTKLQEAGNTIFKVFVDGLTPLIGPLSHLSDAFVRFLQVILRKDGIVEEGINTLAGWLENFSGKLSAPKFLEAVERFTSDIGVLADAIHAIAHPFESLDKGVAGGAFGAASSRSDFLANPTKAGYLARLSDAERGFKLPAGMLAYQWQKESGSSLNPADSRTGAQGPFQIMPGTAKWLSGKYGIPIDPKDPLKAALGAAEYDQWLLEHYHGNTKHALAAYNWGYNNVDASLAGPFTYKGQRKPQGWMPQETRDYVAHAPGVNISIMNATGGNAIVQAAALAH